MNFFVLDRFHTFLQHSQLWQIQTGSHASCAATNSRNSYCNFKEEKDNDIPCHGQYTTCSFRSSHEPTLELMAFDPGKMGSRPGRIQIHDGKTSEAQPSKEGGNRKHTNWIPADPQAVGSGVAISSLQW